MFIAFNRASSHSNAKQFCCKTLESVEKKSLISLYCRSMVKQSNSFSIYYFFLE